MNTVPVPDSPELKAYVIDLTEKEAIAIGTWAVVLGVANVVAFLLTLVLAVVGGVYQLFAGIVHFLIGVSISLGGTGELLLVLFYYLCVVGACLSAGFIAVGVLLAEDGELDLDIDPVTYPLYAVAVPVVVLFLLVNTQLLPGLLSPTPLVLGLFSLWGALRVVGYTELLTQTGGNWKAISLVGFSSGVLAAAWMSVGVTLAVYRQLPAPLPRFAEALATGVKLVPFVEPTPTFALGVTLGLCAGPVALHVLILFVTITKKIFLLQPY